MGKWEPLDRVMLKLNPRAHIWVLQPEKKPKWTPSTTLWVCEKCGLTLRSNKVYKDLGPPGPFMKVTKDELYCDEYLVSRILNE